MRLNMENYRLTTEGIGAIYKTVWEAGVTLDEALVLEALVHFRGSSSKGNLYSYFTKVYPIKEGRTKSRFGEALRSLVENGLVELVTTPLPAAYQLELMKAHPIVEPSTSLDTTYGRTSLPIVGGTVDTELLPEPDYRTLPEVGLENKTGETP